MTMEKFAPSMLDDLSITYAEVSEKRAEVSALEEVLQALDDCECYRPIHTAYDDEIYAPIKRLAEEVRRTLNDDRRALAHYEEDYHRNYYRAYPEDMGVI